MELERSNSNHTEEKRRSGCGLVAAIFQIRRSKSRKQTPSTTGLDESIAIFNVAFQSSFKPSVSPKTTPPPTIPEKPIKKPIFVRRMSSKFVKRNQLESRIKNHPTSMSFVNNSMNSSQVVNLDYTQRLRREPTFNSSELSVTLHRKSSSNGMLYQASQSSVMLVGHLGNLKQPQKDRKPNVVKPPKVVVPRGNGSSSSSSIVKKSGEMHRPDSVMLLTDSGKIMDPEEMKNMGNEMYKKGRFQEALDFYDRAILVDANNASFYSNRSAALMSLGRLFEAVFAGKEAIKIDPTYYNAQYRLARLYLRLGDAEKALYHLNHSGRKANSKDINEAEVLQARLIRCSGARKRGDWDALLNQTRLAISAGADSAPQVYGMQAEALLKLRRHAEAYLALHKIPDLGSDHVLNFLGASKTADLLLIRSQVYVAIGRFDDGVAAAHDAEKLHSSVEVNTIVKRVDAVSQARKDGNDLFKASRFEESAAVYSAALKVEPYNSILLCNRAACRSKLGLLEKAIEDCTLALKLRASYSKARLRRADIYAKLEMWEEALQDYAVLIQEVPGDEKVIAGYEEAKKQAERAQNFDSEELEPCMDTEISFEHSVRVTSTTEFYGNGSSFKFLAGIDISPRSNIPSQFGSPVASLKAIPTH